MKLWPYWSELIFYGFLPVFAAIAMEMAFSR